MTDTKHPRLIPVPMWPQYHQWPTLAALRQLVHYADKRGFQDCVKRVGRRVLIDEDAFYRWVDAQTQKANAEEQPLKPWERTE